MHNVNEVPDAETVLLESNPFRNSILNKLARGQSGLSWCTITRNSKQTCPVDSGTKGCPGVVCLSRISFF